MVFEYKFESIDVSKIYGFQITVFLPTKPKYLALERKFNDYDLLFSENGIGQYTIERKTQPIEASVVFSPQAAEKPSCQITVTYVDLGIKYNSRKEVVDFGIEIISKMSWKQKIVWYTDDGMVTEWIDPDLNANNTRKIGENSCPNQSK
jgi:hypothetical protein